MTLSYEKKNGFLITFCSWDHYEDFLISLSAVKDKIDGKECFILPIEKEKELIKIINYLNMIDNGKSRHSQTKYHREDSEDEEKEDKISDRIAFFKSFGEKDFKKKQVKISSDDEDGDESEGDKSEYSSSSYDSSSSDNFPSPKTPKKRSNYSNEQLYFMIEKIQRKIDLIERILEKKLLK